jgi:hypothetical protein
MSVYKPFTTSDIIVTPFEVNKSFTFKGGMNLTGSNVGIERYIGKNTQDQFLGFRFKYNRSISTQKKKLVYDSIKQLYYSNFLSR